MMIFGSAPRTCLDRASRNEKGIALLFAEQVLRNKNCEHKRLSWVRLQGRVLFLWSPACVLRTSRKIQYYWGNSCDNLHREEGFQASGPDSQGKATAGIKLEGRCCAIREVLGCVTLLRKGSGYFEMAAQIEQKRQKHHPKLVNHVETTERYKYAPGMRNPLLLPALKQLLHFSALGPDAIK